jgi:hypothetical protein
MKVFICLDSIASRLLRSQQFGLTKIQEIIMSSTHVSTAQIQKVEKRFTAKTIIELMEAFSLLAIPIGLGLFMGYAVVEGTNDIKKMELVDAAIAANQKSVDIVYASGRRETYKIACTGPGQANAQKVSFDAAGNQVLGGYLFSSPARTPQCTGPTPSAPAAG